MVSSERLTTLMDEYGLDVLIIVGNKNALYFCGSCVDDEVLTDTAQGLCGPNHVIAPPDNSFSLRMPLEVTRLPSELFPSEAHPKIPYFVEHKNAIIVEQLKKRRLDRARIGVDMGHCPASTLRYLQSALPNADFVDGELLVMRLRAVKTHDEIDKIQKATDIAEQAFAETHDVCTEGTSWGTIIHQWGKRVIDLGAVPAFAHPFEFVNPDLRSASSPNTAVEHSPSTSLTAAKDGLVRWPLVLERGVTTRVDLGVCFKGYYSDFKYPVCLGEPRPEAVARVQADVKRSRFMERVVRPGMTKRELQESFEKEFVDGDGHPWYFHGVGMDIHEEPRLFSFAPDSPDIRELTIEVNQVLAFEPSWIVEESVVIQADGVRRLCKGSTTEITVL